MASVDRNCFCCGAHYQWCGQGCKNEDPTETWRYLFDNATCFTVYDLWQAYRGKEITDVELCQKIENMNIDYILNSDTKVAKDFKEIIERVNKKAEEKVVNNDESENDGEVKPDENHEDHETHRTLSISEELKQNENKKIVPNSRVKK